MSTGILSDILAGFLLIVDLAIWFLDFGERKEKGISPPFLFSVSIYRLVCLMLLQCL